MSKNKIGLLTKERLKPMRYKSRARTKDLSLTVCSTFLLSSFNVSLSVPSLDFYTSDAFRANTDPEGGFKSLRSDRIISVLC